jgi:proton-coupled amino acid transporter
MWHNLIIKLELLSISLRAQIRNLKFLAPLSTIANFVTLISFGLILYFIFEKPFSIEDKQAVASIKSFPLFFGTVLFALGECGAYARHQS